MPEEATLYALPEQWREWGICRYGFHGLSVEWAASQVKVARLVVCHLGGGSSVTAVLDGRSVETTMGFSPLEGLPMTTRSGSVDPAALLYLLRERGLSIDELDRRSSTRPASPRFPGRPATSANSIRTESHSGCTSAVWLQRSVPPPPRSAASTRSSSLRAWARTRRSSAHEVCERLSFLGIELDATANADATPDTDIATAGSVVRVHVVRAREELVVAQAVQALLSAPTGENSLETEGHVREGQPAEVLWRKRATQS